MNEHTENKQKYGNNTGDHKMTSSFYFGHV